MTQMDWQCLRCTVKVRAQAQPCCPICREPMTETPDSALKTKRLRRCCLEARRRGV